MEPILKVASTLGAALFAGGALYISVVEHPARQPFRRPRCRMGRPRRHVGARSHRGRQRHPVHAHRHATHQPPSAGPGAAPGCGGPGPPRALGTAPLLLARAVWPAALDWARIWWFLPIAAGSYAFALVGYVAAKRRWRGWLIAHIAGQGGSYIAMTTALLVVNWQSLTGVRGIHSPLAWALPTLVGTPLIIWLNYQVRRGRRPRLPR